MVLAAVSAAHKERAEDRVGQFKTAVPVVGLAELTDVADVIVETAPPECFAEIAEPAIRAGRILMPLSVTSLLERMDLVDLAPDAKIAKGRTASEEVGAVREVDVELRDGLGKPVFDLRRGLCTRPDEPDAAHHSLDDAAGHLRDLIG